MTAYRFPAALSAVVEGAVRDVLALHQAGKYPEFAYDRGLTGEVEVVILAIDHPRPECVVDFDALTRTDKVRRILGDTPWTPRFRTEVAGRFLEGQADEQPIAAHGVAEEDGA